jgi:hypothetical protein
MPNINELLNNEFNDYIRRMWLEAPSITPREPTVRDYLNIYRDFDMSGSMSAVVDTPPSTALRDNIDINTIPPMARRMSASNLRYTSFPDHVLMYDHSQSALSVSNQYVRWSIVVGKFNSGPLLTMKHFSPEDRDSLLDTFNQGNPWENNFHAIHTAYEAICFNGAEFLTVLRVPDTFNAGETREAILQRICPSHPRGRAIANRIFRTYDVIFGDHE